MVRERTVRLEELASRRICTKRREYFVCIKSARTVACVYNDLKALERFFLAGGLPGSLP